MRGDGDDDDAERLCVDTTAVPLLEKNIARPSYHFVLTGMFH